MNKNNQTLKDTFAKAFESYKKRDFKNAEIYCYKILSIDSNHFDSMSLLANIAAISKNFNKAIELLNKLVQVHPNNIIAIHNLGSAYKDLGKLDGMTEKQSDELYETVGLGALKYFILGPCFKNHCV